MNQEYFHCPTCDSDETVFTSTGRECAVCGTPLRVFVEDTPIWRHGRLSGYEVRHPRYGWQPATPEEMERIHPHLYRDSGSQPQEATE